MIDSAVQRLVPGLEHGESPLHVERLTGGSVNDVFRVDTVAGRFVLRVDGPQWRRPGVDRARELAIHACAATAGLAPRLIRTAPNGVGPMVMEYLSGRVWSEDDCCDPRALVRIGVRLAQLHRLQVPPRLVQFDPLRIAMGYVAAISPGNESGDESGSHELAQIMQRLRSILGELATTRRPPTIIHGDLFHSNVIEGTRLWLLDWEYAQISDPLMDVACLLAYYPAARPQATELLASADLAGVDPCELQLRIDVYRILSWLWHRARGEVMPHP